MLIAGNWKMNMVRKSSMALLADLKASLASVANVDVAVFPPSVYLSEAASFLQGSNIGLGAQNVNSKPEGAFTGEVSCGMLLDVGCRYVILGHSERRALFGETDATVNEKLHAALDAGLTPIVCVGETLEDREGGRTMEVVRTQCQGSLSGISEAQMRSTIVAYEPVWAIGTGKTATPEQAEEVHADIRALLGSLFTEDISMATVLLYGGSVKPELVTELLKKPNIDGGLVGGASLKSDLFSAIVQAADGVRK
jgi:triosephosphate isomerase (TIM)